MNPVAALAEVAACIGALLAAYGFLSLVLVPFRRSTEWSEMDRWEAVNRVLKQEVER